MAGGTSGGPPPAAGGPRVAAGRLCRGWHREHTPRPRSPGGGSVAPRGPPPPPPSPFFPEPPAALPSPRCPFTPHRNPSPAPAPPPPVPAHAGCPRRGRGGLADCGGGGPGWKRAGRAAATGEAAHGAFWTMLLCSSHKRPGIKTTRDPGFKAAGEGKTPIFSFGLTSRKVP